MELKDLADVATIIGALAIIVVAIQAAIAFRQFKADHERSRREKAVDLLFEWSKALKKEWAIVRKIIETLTEEQCREVFAQQKITIPEKQKKLLLHFFDEKVLEEKESGEAVLSEAQSSELRWHAISYLNSLEAVLIAWQYSVVDRGMVESQFGYLFRPEQGHSALKYFRVAAGGELSYPATEIFSSHIERKRRELLQEKANVA